MESSISDSKHIDTPRSIADPSRARAPAPLARSLDRWAARIVRQRWLWMVLGCLSFLPLAYWQTGLSMNRSLAAMFAPDDPALVDYQNLQAAFGGNLVVMLVYDDEQLMSAAGLARSRRWTERAEQIEGVDGVLSVAKLVDAFTFLRPQMPFSSSTGDAQRQVALFSQDDSVAQQFRDLFSGYTHSSDEQTAAIVVMLGADTTDNAQRVSQTVDRLRGLAAEFPADAKAMLVGEPVLLQDAFDLIIADGRRLAIGTIGLLCLVILITLRDLRVVLLAAMCIVWSSVATRACMVGLGVELSLVSAILLALVAVIAVAAVMHIAVRCQRPGQSLVGALAILGVPIACTCLTDAAGFAALMVSAVRPVVEFGIMTATAACCVLLSLVLFSPWAMGLPDRLRCRPGARTGRGDDSLRKRVLPLVAGQSVRYRAVLSIASIGILLVSAGYVMRLETNSSFLDNFRRNSPIVSAYSRVEERLGGAGVWDVVLPAPATITAEYLQRVRDLEARLREIEVHELGVPVAGVGNERPGALRLSKVLSLADADAVASQVTLLAFVSPEVRLAGMRAAIPTFAAALLTFPAGDEADGPARARRLRIMIRSKESLSGPAKTALMSEVQLAVQAAGFGIPSADSGQENRSSEVAVTGYSVLMSQLVASLVRDQWTALGVALGAVGLLILAVTRSLALTIAALVVNTLPILVVLSLTGMLGGQLDLGSAMIGAVSIGLSIDGSIHFLSGYQRRSRAGGSTVEAAIGAASDLGAPILLASAALVIGFAVLVTSPFVPTATFGLLVAATLALSALVNLTLLPAMVVWLD